MEVQKQEPQKEKKKSKFMKYFGRSLLTGLGFYAIFYASMYDVIMYKHKIRTEEEIQ